MYLISKAIVEVETYDQRDQSHAYRHGLDAKYLK